MRSFSLFLVALMLLWAVAGCAESQVHLQDVFWDNLWFLSEQVDFSKPLPDCKSGDSPYCKPGRPDDHAQCWKVFWYESGAVLEWNGFKISAAGDKEEAPNYNDWVHWDCNVIEVWADYFTEMYYEGGVDNPLAAAGFDEFWMNLRYEGKPIDPHLPPPNYDPAMDYYADIRSEIGYHWYWEYYFGSQHNYISGEVADLEWNGIPFDVTTYPNNYIMEEDPLPYNRLQRGYMEYWAEYFLNNGK